MSRLPTVTPHKVVKALLRAGFFEDHQHGSHLTLYNPTTDRQTVVPMHAGDLHRGLLKGILKQAGLSEDEFRGLL